MKIFLSSTYADLKSERQAIAEFCQQIREHFVGMEIFRSSSRTPLETSLKELAASDVALFVVGHRYGSIDPKSGKSIVQLEYETAIAQKKAIKLYMKDDSVPVAVGPIDFENRDKLKEFKNTLGKHTYVKFRSPDHLVSLVALDLIELSTLRGSHKTLDYSAIEKHSTFWSDTIANSEVDIIVEVGKYTHKGEIEEAKNINGALGVASLIATLTEKRIAYTMQPAQDGLRLATNVILDGSHTGNRVTQSVITTLGSKLVYANNNSDDLTTRWITYSEMPDSKVFETVYRDGLNHKRIRYDYGFLARVQNPRAPRCHYLIASGNHGAGTYACMKFLSSPGLTASLYDAVGSDEFQAVIGIECGRPYQMGDPILHEVVKLKT